MSPLSYTVVGLAGLWAGAQNAIAGGGSFVTFPSLLFAGLDPRAANITSTIALFPGQVTTGITGRSMAEGAVGLSFKTLVVVSLIGGALGGLLLLATPVSIFTHLVPWLIMFATLVFIWGNFFAKKRAEGAPPPVGRKTAVVLQFLISIYGGYFGGGIGILMLAALTAAGMAVRAAGATKNVLGAVMNFSAVLLFLAESRVPWGMVAVLAVTAVIGGQLGVVILRRAPMTLLRLIVAAIGTLLTIGMFLRA
ncbi:sulfite exporter TauE/SafE family protein [Acidocella sp.]|uniref:sulfite exporter TauE/SafE family protein n=1 Tax=Acidocella sp. TaxID=50710 RepID=UPI00261DE74F|nr:sulfite exporter TauE/SafE family protein [Acidocella sp.]